MSQVVFAGGRVELDVDAAVAGVSGGTITYYGRIIARRAGGTGIFTLARMPWSFTVNGASIASGSGGSGWLYDWRGSSNERITIWQGTWAAASGVVQNFSGSADTNGYGSGSTGGSVVGTADTGGGGGWPAGKPSFSYVGGAAITAATAGETVSVYTNRAGSETHVVAYAIGSASGIVINNNVGASVNWALPLSICNQLPNAVRGAVTVGVTNNSTGAYQSNTLDVSVPASVVPTISSLSIDDDNPTVKSLIGAFVQGHSVLRASVNAAGAYGSAIRDATYTIDGVTVASGGVVQLRESGSRSVQASATDSRSRSTSASSSVTVLAYSDPNQSTLARRCNASGVLTDNGAYLRVDVNAAVQSLVVGGAEKNGLTIRVNTRQVGTSTWIARNVISPVGLTYNSNFVISGGGIFDITKSYDVQVTVEDKLKSNVNTSQVATAKILVDFDGNNGVGIGRYRQQGTLDVEGNTHTSQDFVAGEGVYATSYVTSPTLERLGMHRDRWGRAKLVDNGNFNELIETGWYRGSQMLNSPDGNSFWWHIMVQNHDDTWVRQTAALFNSHVLWARYRENGTWSAWARVSAQHRIMTGRTNTAASGATAVSLSGFTQPPIVVAGRINHPNVCVAYISAVTATGFNIQTFTLGGAQVAATVDWEATQMTPTSATD